MLLSTSARRRIPRAGAALPARPRDDVQEFLNALVTLGLARGLNDNRYAP
jgi:hypothetical protein